MTREQLTQRAGLPGLNGGGTAAAVPPLTASTIRVSCSKQAPINVIFTDAIVVEFM